MSRYLKLDKKFYGDDGLLSLYRGDDWAIDGKVVDRTLGYEVGVDLSQYSASAYFPAATGGGTILATAATGSCGSLSVVLDAATTPQVMSNQNGQAIYVVLKDAQGKLQTVPTIDQAVAVLDRDFPLG